MKIYNMITEKEIDDVWGSAKFGVGNYDLEHKKQIIFNSVLKMNAGWSTGYTIFQICLKLGLVNEKRKVTKKGKFLLYEYFSSLHV